MLIFYLSKTELSTQIDNILKSLFKNVEKTFFQNLLFIFSLFQPEPPD